LFLDSVSRHLDKFADFGGLSAAEIHDKICVLIGKRRATDTRPLQTRSFEKSSGKIAGRVFEDRAGIGHSAWLPRRALGAQLRDSGDQALAISVREREIHPRDREMRGQFGAPVREFYVVASERERGAGLGHAMHQRYDFGNFAAERAGIHDQPAADSAGDTFAEFEPLEAPIDNGLDQGSERGGGTRDNFDAISIEIYFFETVAETQHQAAHPAIAYQQVGARAEAEARNAGAICGGLGVHQLGFVFDINKQIRRPADLK
jgi:hypothetical protein